MVDETMEQEAEEEPEPGIDLAFDHATAKLDTNLDDLRALDTKAATMIALLGGAVAAYLIAAVTVWERIVGGAVLASAVGTALWAYRIRDYQDAPRPDTFATYAGYPPPVMKQQFLRAAIDAWQANRAQLSRKGKLVNATFYLVAALALLVIVVRLFNLDTRLPQ